MNPKHSAFLQEYQKTGNATASYMKMYPEASRSTANVNGSHLVAKYWTTLEESLEGLALDGKRYEHFNILQYWLDMMYDPKTPPKVALMASQNLDKKFDKVESKIEEQKKLHPLTPEAYPSLGLGYQPPLDKRITS